MTNIKKITLHQKKYKNFSIATDHVAVEEPLEIRLVFYVAGKKIQKSISITMRTPGNDKELALGFLFTEGIIDSKHNIQTIDHCGPLIEGAISRNIMRVELTPEIVVQTKYLDRNFYTTSSCGVCGKASIEALQVQNKYSNHLSLDSFLIAENTIHALPKHLSMRQTCFDITGGVHATGLFTKTGEIIYLHEDVGRHNAMDKMIGQSLLEDKLPFSDKVIMLSGRISFELVQKASMVGAPFIAAVGAPSSLAIELAQKMNITLVGFVRENSFNVYHGHERISIN